MRILCVLALTAGLASADTVIDLSGGGGLLGSTLDFTVDGITVRVTASRQSGALESLTQDAGGLGVRVNANDSFLFDSMGANEQLGFEIIGLPGGVTDVVLKEIEFSQFDVGLDGFRYFAHGSSVVNNKTPGNPWDLTSDGDISLANRTFILNDGFTLRAVEIGQEEVFYRVKSITFAGEPIPEPSTMALVATGVGLAWVRRRRKKRA